MADSDLEILHMNNPTGKESGSLVIMVCLVLLVLAGSSVLLSCKQENESWPSPSTSTSDNTIPEMLIRDIPETDPLLDPRFTNPQAGFSIRPPAGWTKLTEEQLEDYTKEIDKNIQDLRLKGKASHYDAFFRESETQNFLNIIRCTNGPEVLDLSHLNNIKETNVNAIKMLMGDKAKIHSAEIFQFKDFKVIQIVTYLPEVITLNLLLFAQPKVYYQLTYSIEKEKYSKISRQIEASIASSCLTESDN